MTSTLSTTLNSATINSLGSRRMSCVRSSPTSGRTGSTSLPRSIGCRFGSLADYANTVRTPGYLLLGIQAGLTLPKAILPIGPLPYAVSFYLDARNLTSRHYVSDLETVVNASKPANQEIYFPGDGRAIYAGVKLTF